MHPCGINTVKQSNRFIHEDPDSEGNWLHSIGVVRGVGSHLDSAGFNHLHCAAWNVDVTQQYAANKLHLDTTNRKWVSQQCGAKVAMLQSTFSRSEVAEAD